MKASIKSTIIISSVAMISISIAAFLYNFSSPTKRKPFIDKRPIIETLHVKNVNTPIQVPIIGKLTAKNKISIYAEVSGVLEGSQKEFMAGQNYRAGEVMLMITNDEAELTLKSKRSDLLTAIATLLPELKLAYPKSYEAWSDYITQCNIDQKLQPLPILSEERERFMVAGKGIPKHFYEIKTLEARLDKYQIRAPFDGTLISHSIRTGDLVRSGQELGIFINPHEYELEAKVSLDDMASIQINDVAKLATDRSLHDLTGSVERINQGLDPKTQMFSIFISIFDNTVYEGMYLTGHIIASKSQVGVQIPRTMLIDGNSVLIYKEGHVFRRTVNIAIEQGEYVIVTDLPEGVQVSTRVQNLRSGQEVRTVITDPPDASPPARTPRDGKSGKNRGAGKD